MKLLIDFFPIILFFIAYKLSGIYVATITAIIAALAQVAWLRWRHGSVEKMPLITLALILVFGGLTLLLRDPIFVMWKPTIVNWLFAGAFLGTSLVGKRPLVERMMGQAVSLPAPIWRRLNWAWVLFFLISGLANLFVVYIGSGFYAAEQALIAATAITAIDLNSCADQFIGQPLLLCETAHESEAVWVNFKLFGMMGLTILFVIGQAFYLARHFQDADPADLDPGQSEPAQDPLAATSGDIR
ncbi:MAG: septation protein A [Lamprobacter sp.]|uniref:septation protein A n=1 Tax=Lamprobacter sp. TaxID=3100796 RepID=UPI002B262F20|nr:septation protein A [Lamprobacter sp.]MEA3641048.1 septation protein A [Lamprobacter sp.]